MDSGVETIERIAWARARRDAHVLAGTRRERMHRLVHAAMAHVIAERFGELARQLHLFAFVKIEVEIGRLLGCHHFIAQCRQSRPQRCEHRA